MMPQVTKILLFAENLPQDENGTFVLSMPYPPSTRFPSAWADDTGVVVDSVLRAGTKYHGKTITLATEVLPQDSTLASWAERMTP